MPPKKSKAAKPSRLFDPSSSAPFTISRTKLDDFLKCPRCFYLDRRMGISKPSMPAFSLNVAVDYLLKKEFDYFRAEYLPHPIMVKNELQAVPFKHPDLNDWRNNFKGIRFHHAASNLILFGAIDDVWQMDSRELAVVDYKATSTRQPLSLDSEWRQGYKRQLEIYQWLFRQNLFPVSKTAFILYANACKDRNDFFNKLEFEMTLLRHEGDFNWVGEKLIEAKKCLMGDLPEPSTDCEWCQYREALN